MRVVRVLALLAAGGGEVHHPHLLVDVVEAGRDELPFGDPVLQLPRVRVVEVEVRPAVALGPEHQLLAVVHQAQRLALDVGVQALFDERLDLAGLGVDDADVQLVHVAAQAREVQLVGRGAQPLRRPADAADRGEPMAPARVAIDIVWSLKRSAFTFTRPLRRDVEHPHLGLRDVLLTGHRVAVGLERRTRRAERVDDPEVLHQARIAAHQRELARVGRPDHVAGADARFLASSPCSSCWFWF